MAIMSTRYRRFAVLASISAFLMCFLSSGFAETTLEKIKRTGAMTAAASFEYAPFNFVEGGKFAGFDVDLGTEISRRMGVKLTWSKVDFKGIIAALNSSRVDVLIAAMTRTPERAKQILFSASYFDGGIGAAYRVNNPVSRPDELKGKIVGIEIGSAGAAWVREGHAKNIKELKTYDTVFLALKDLQSGRVDVVVSSLPSVRYNARRIQGVAYSAAWDSREVGINTRNNDQDFMDEINLHMGAMKADGTLKKIEDKWFGLNQHQVN
jgi:ABC-type amino acid transport substrate-binding protein